MYRDIRRSVLMKRREILSCIQAESEMPLRVVTMDGNTISGYYEAFWLKEYNGYDGFLIRPLAGTLRGRCVEIPAEEIVSITEYDPVHREWWS